MTQIEYPDYLNWLNKGTNNLQSCSICNKRIHAEELRVSFSYSGRYGTTGYKRICAECILELARLI